MKNQLVLIILLALNLPLSAQEIQTKKSRDLILYNLLILTA
jgi:hypothetical protein